MFFFFFKQKTAYDMRISDWSSDVCSSDLLGADSFLSGAPDYVLGETDSDAILKHVMAQADEPQAPAGVAADPLLAAVLPQAEPPTLVAPVLPELGDDIQIIRNKESISFRINSEILYSSGKADLSLAGMAVMRRLVPVRSEEHTSELQSLMRIPYAVCCLKK